MVNYWSEQQPFMIYVNRMCKASLSTLTCVMILNECGSWTSHKKSSKYINYAKAFVMCKFHTYLGAILSHSFPCELRGGF